MKKFSGLIIFIVAVALIYTGFWFYQAHKVKELVVYHLNQYEKPDAEGYQIKVDNVSVHGYPFNYVVKLTNPKYVKTQEPKSVRIAVDGAIKFGTDILGRSYWVKQEGDVNYLPNSTDEQAAKRYKVKGNLELKADVAHPQYVQALMHPFFGLPKVFYKENPSFQELLNELKMASYEDHDFGMYEIDGETKQLVGFSKGWVRWKHSPEGKEDEKFVFNLDLKDFEAAENGRPLLPHLKKLMDLNTDMALDVPYILNSGKNNISLDFEATLPQNFDVWNFFNYKNVNVELKKLEMDNLYGHTSANFDLAFTEKEKDGRNLHVGFNTESIITEKGSEAIHRQFIDGIKLRVAAQPSDPENKVLVDLLKCCEDTLQDIIPNYMKLGKMQFIFDADVKIKNVLKNPALDKIIVSHFDALAKPYGIKSHGTAEFANNQPKGKYEIDWMNYKEMIHDVIVYYNRIHPIFEKFAEANNQPMPIGLITAEQEKEIVDFFKSISNDPSQDNTDVTITIDFTDINNPKIGQNSVEQVKQAWDKLVTDIMKPETPSAKPSAPSVKPATPAPAGGKVG